VSTVGSVVVTNLTTGKRLGSLDKAEVIYYLVRSFFLLRLHMLDCSSKICSAGGCMEINQLPFPFCTRRVLLMRFFILSMLKAYSFHNLIVFFL
jgi:hypothetical protein